MAPQQGSYRGSSARIGNMVPFDSFFSADVLKSQMLIGSGAGRAVIDHPGIGPGEFDQLFHRFPGRVFADADTKNKRDRVAKRIEICQGVVFHLERQWRYRKRLERRISDRVAVGLGMGDLIGSNRVGAADFRNGNHGHAKRLRQQTGKHPAGEVGRSTGCGTLEDLDRLCREFFLAAASPNDRPAQNIPIRTKMRQFFAENVLSIIVESSFRYLESVHKRTVSRKVVIPAPIFMGINSSRNPVFSRSLDTGSSPV